MSYDEEGLEVSVEYLSLQKRTIKELQILLKMRLRTENQFDAEQNLVLSMFKITDFSEKIENLFLQLNKKQKLFQDSLNKAKKYDDLLKRINEIEQNYKQKNNNLLETIQQLEQDNAKIKEENQDQQEKNKKQNSEIFQFQTDIKSTEKTNEALKKQISNLNSLMKQVNEEKEFNSQKMTDVVDIKIKGIKEEVQKVRNQYQQKLEEKELKIEKLERELDLLKKEIELNEEFTFLQSSANSNFSKPFSPDKSQGKKNLNSEKKSHKKEK